MSCEPYSFKNVDSIANSMLMNALEINMKYWFDWSLLQIGAWDDVTLNTSGAYGGDFSTLRLVDDQTGKYDAGQVWESCRKDWVWESGISYTNPYSNTTLSPLSPIIYINGLSSGVPSYSIDYPNGKVTFDTAIDTSFTVQAQYSSRQIQTYIADDADWWNQLQYKSFNVEDSYFLQTEQGTWTIGAEKRVQMPAIVVEAIPNTESRGYEVGSGALWVRQDIYCHILAENRRDRNRIMDILLRQQDRTIQLFSPDAISKANDYPLNYKGDIVDNTKTYQVLADTYPYAKCHFIKTSSRDVLTISPKLFNGVVRMTCEVSITD